jgi:glycosyltransferase involved in cell wall biosynthesis
MLDLITPLILTRDEEANIERTLRQLEWARDVVVVDSLSTDATVEIARRFPNVRVFSRELDSLAGQCNFALAQIRTPWALALDADFFVPGAFVDELATLVPPPGTHAYRASFRYAIHGKPLRGSLYPPREALLHREHCTFWQDGHAHRVRVDGATGELRTPLIHDDRKDFRRFLERQRRYMRQEAAKLRAADPRTLNLAGRIRKLIVVAPFAVVVHTLFVKGLILDGRAGWWYAWERFVAEWMLSAELMKRSAEGRVQKAE